MKQRKDYIIVVKRKGVVTYLFYKVVKGENIKMTFKDRYETLKDNATVFNSYGKAFSMLIHLENSKDQSDIAAGESYDIIERGDHIER
jgi:hypothetical protein